MYTTEFLTNSTNDVKCIQSLLLHYYEYAKLKITKVCNCYKNSKTVVSAVLMGGKKSHFKYRNKIISNSNVSFSSANILV